MPLYGVSAILPPQRVVHAQKTILVEPENQSRAKLSVHITYGDATPVEVGFDVQMRDTVSAEIRLVAQHRPLQQFASGGNRQSRKARFVLTLVVIADAHIHVGVAQVVDVCPLGPRGGSLFGDVHSREQALMLDGT